MVGLKDLRGKKQWWKCGTRKHANTWLIMLILSWWYGCSFVLHWTCSLIMSNTTIRKWRRTSQLFSGPFLSPVSLHIPCSQPIPCPPTYPVPHPIRCSIQRLPFIENVCWNSVLEQLSELLVRISWCSHLFTVEFSWWIMFQLFFRALLRMTLFLVPQKCALICLNAEFVPFWGLTVIVIN